MNFRWTWVHLLVELGLGPIFFVRLESICMVAWTWVHFFYGLELGPFA